MLLLPQPSNVLLEYLVLLARGAHRFSFEARNLEVKGNLYEMKRSRKQDPATAVAAAAGPKRSKADEFVVKQQPVDADADERDEDMDRLSSDPTYNVPQLTRYLKRIGFLDASLGVREMQQSRDPMLIILYNPNKPLVLADGTRTTVINDLLDSAHALCSETYGDLYDDFELIQCNRQALRASKDTHAKQVYYLCLLAINPGLQDQLRTLYPRDGGREVNRLDAFVKVIKSQIDQTLNTAYVNVPRPSVYNIDRMVANFLTACAWAYPG